VACRRVYCGYSQWDAIRGRSGHSGRQISAGLIHGEASPKRSVARCNAKTGLGSHQGASGAAREKRNLRSVAPMSQLRKRLHGIVTVPPF
jgi:hypothetical protein